MRRIITKSFRKKSYLKLTPGEEIRDMIIQKGIEAAKESGYAAGNTTEKLLKVADKIGNVVDRGSQLVGGSEAAGSLGRVAFKTTTDIARGDTICTGLCAISLVCESLALGCSALKIIPYRGGVYVAAKTVSKGCMSYRNLCAGKGC